jgi:hypothetical protein
MSERISPAQFSEAEGIADRRVLGDGACAYFYFAAARVVTDFTNAPMRALASRASGTFQARVWKT